MEKIPCPFRGCATALVTPFKGGEVDYDALGSLIDFQIDKGIDAIVVLGTTGEAPTISEDERYKIIVNLGGAYANKQDAIERFKITFNELDESIRKRIVLNNVDNTIDVNTTLNICKEFAIPYYLNPNLTGINMHIVENCIKSWENTDLPALLGLRSESNLVKLAKLDKNIDVIIKNFSGL